jgi:tetratricopeptide (TPR) repeat protein
MSIGRRSSRFLALCAAIGLLSASARFAVAEDNAATKPKTTAEAESKPQGGNDTDTKTQAVEHFRRGKVAFDLGHFAEALKQYESAYRLLPAPKMLFNIGQCYRNLNRYEQALFAFRRYRRELPNAPNIQAVEKLLVELKEKLRLQHEAERKEKEEKKRRLDEATRLAKLQAASRPAVARDIPIYKKWWFWTVVGSVALGGGAVGVYFATRPAELPSSLFPVWDISR